MIINQFRTYYPDYTESELFIDGGYRFCWVLEDIGRPPGVKLPGETCIPEGHYKAIISRSATFNKMMILLYNQTDMSVERYGVRFTGIRAHGGTNTEHTAGCPLLNYNNYGNGKMSRRASDDVCGMIKVAIDSGESVDWIITEKAVV
jgi:hypothetical protein